MTYDLNWSSDQTFGTLYRQVGNLTGMWEMVLFAEFMTVTIIGTIANKKSTGFSNTFDWMLLAGFVTFLSSLFLNLGGMIEMTTVIIIASVTMVLFLGNILTKVFKIDSMI